MRNSRVALVPNDPNLVEIAEEYDLPDLDDQKMAFVRGIASGKQAVQAYKDAGYNLDHVGGDALYRRAVRLRAHKPVKKWLTAIRLADIEATTYTRNQHLAELEEVRNYALENGVPGAAVQAIANKGKVMGFYEDRLKVDTSKDPQDLVNELRELFGDDMANAFAAKLIRKTKKEHEDDAE